MKKKSFFNKKSKFILLFLLLIVGISFGYAALGTTLIINGTAKVTKTDWIIHFKNLQVTNGSFLNDDANTVALSENDTKVTYTVTLKEPGQFYEFTVNIANDGSLAAKLDDVRDSSVIKYYDSTSDSWVNYSGTISDLHFITETVTGVPAENSVLNPGSANYIPVTVRVEYPFDIEATDLPDKDYSFTKTIELDYVQNQ